MNEQPFFGLSSYHLAMALVGAGIIAAFWLPRFLSGREPAASALMILFGIAIHWILPDLSRALDPREAPLFWELVSELAVIVALFGTGIRIDNVTDYRRWRPTISLLAIAMPLTIGAVTFMGFAIAGMTLAGALVLGAVLAPTDPVLAGEVQVGPPTEGGEHPVRFALTTEAGLNDGLAFPFVYLALLAGTSGLSGAMLGEWLLLDVLYRIGVGVAGGAIVGWGLARVLFVIPRGNVLADTASGVLAIAGVLLCYGVTELAEGYGFIACFVAGVVLRRVEAEHAFHAELHSFNEAIELALTAVLLILIGATFPLLFGELDWAHAAIAFALLFIVRPGAGWISLLRTGLPPTDRLVIAFYGVRGIGSIYYLGFAASHLELVNEGQLWATIALTILLSTVVHGFTAGPVVDYIVRRRQA
jgi:sodium/hydrogen antiporter